MHTIRLTDEQIDVLLAAVFSQLEEIEARAAEIERQCGKPSPYYQKQRDRLQALRGILTALPLSPQ